MSRFLRTVRRASLTLLGLGVVLLLLGVIFWQEVEHFLAPLVASWFAYRILRHRYFPQNKKE